MLFVPTNSLRNFDREGYSKGGQNWYATNKYVRLAIQENMSRTYNEKGPEKWLHRVTISDWDTTDGKIRKLAGLMTLLTEHASRSRIVRDVARAIVRGYDVEPKDYLNEMWALQHWIQNNVRYTFDTGEQFQTPQRVLIDWYRRHDGADCDCLSMLYLALVGAMGHRKIAVGLVDSRGDETISHAIALVKLAKPMPPWEHKWIPIELTKSVKFGWLTPKATRMLVVPLGGAKR